MNVAIRKTWTQDAFVPCSMFKETDRLIAGIVVVFEVISPSSGQIDRIVKRRDA